MKRIALFSLVALAALLVQAAQQPVPFAFVKGASGGGGGGGGGPAFIAEIARELVGWRAGWTSNTHTFSDGAAAGTTVVVLAQGPGGSTTPTVTDARGNTYTARAQNFDTGAGRFYVLTAPVTTPIVAGDTFTVTYSSSVTGGSSAAVWSFSSVTGVDVTTNGYYGYGTTVDVSLTTTTAPTLVLGFVQKNFADFTGSTITSGTALVTPLALGTQALGVLYLNAATSGAKTVGYTFPAADNFVYAGIALK